MAENIDDVFRDWNVLGDPASGEYEPEKPRIRALLWQIQAAGGQSVTRNTLAQLNAVTPPTENYMGIVLNDPDAANNGYYYRNLGAWVWSRGFPDTFAEGVLSGSGSAQTASFNAGVNPADIEVFWSSVATENTGALTLNGKPVLSVAGNPLVSGEWSGIVLYVDEGPNWRLLIDVNAAQIASQAASDAVIDAGRAEDAADRAEAAASSVEFPVSYAPQSLTPEQQAQARENIGAVTRVLDDIHALLAYAPTVAPDTLIVSKGVGGGAVLSPFKRVDSEPTTIGGKAEIATGIFYKFNKSDVDFTDSTFGGDPYGVEPSADALQNAIDFLWEEGGGVVTCPEHALFNIEKQVTLRPNVRFNFRSARFNFSRTDNMGMFYGAGVIDPTVRFGSQNVAFGDNHFTPTTGASFYQRGDYVFLTSDELFDQSGVRQGEFCQVAGVTLGRLTFGPDSWVRGRYLLADDVRAYKMTPLVGVEMRGGYFFGSNSYGTSIMGSSVNDASPSPAQSFLRIINAAEIHMDDVHVTDFHGAGVQYINVITGTFQNGSVKNGISTASNSYGFTAANASQDITVSNCHFDNMRHHIAQGGSNLDVIGLAGITRRIKYIGNSCNGSNGYSNPIDVHPSCEDATIGFNSVHGGTRAGILARGRNMTIVGNTVDQCLDLGIYESNDTYFLGTVNIGDNAVTRVMAGSTHITATETGGNLMQFFPGETVTREGSDNPNGVVLSVLHFNGEYRLLVRMLSGTFTGTAPIVGRVSGARTGNVSDITTLTSAVGIHVRGFTTDYATCTISGNALNGQNSPATYVGVLLQDVSCASVTANAITLPTGATGAGVHFMSGSNDGFAGSNLMRVIGTNSTALAIRDQGTGNTHASWNKVVNF